ncbi:Protein TED1 [Spathaspora sp. JA1]|nr:Protein TED1 [Spathaspora sp. JA1]
MKSKWFNVFVESITVVAFALNCFVYFYPDILNETSKCNWHNFNKDTPQIVNSKYPFLNTYVSTSILEKILLNFPQLRAASTDNKSPYEDDNMSRVKDIHMLTFGDPQINGNWPSTKYIKRLDNYGNDYYLGHIYNVMKKRLNPSHVAVMGDQFSSQWILDSEFYNRTYRFVERLFSRPLEYKQTVIDTYKDHTSVDWNQWLEQERALDPSVRFASRTYQDVYDWVKPQNKFPNFENPLFINLTGNHDIGYSGDATWQHMTRFHLLFGQNNYVINYNQGTPEAWRLVVLDSLTLEGPALQPEFIDYTWSFLHHLRDRENPGFKGPTVLLTHIPFYKIAGLCRDGPEHIYYIDNKREPYKNGNLRSQNHLSYETTQQVLDIVFPNPDQNGIVLTGHDHEGCDSWYNKIGDEWVASKSKFNQERQSIREIVVRSMMGDFNGQTGIFTGHFNYLNKIWEFEFSYCSFTVQHIWWASKVTLLLAILLQSINRLF